MWGEGGQERKEVSIGSSLNVEVTQELQEVVLERMLGGGVHSCSRLGGAGRVW